MPKTININKLAYPDAKPHTNFWCRDQDLDTQSEKVTVEK